jgi:hypothetical protein
LLSQKCNLYRYAQDLPVTTEWSAECFALAVFSSRILTFGPLGVALVALVLAVLIARRTPMHPYNPLTAGLSLPRGVRLLYGCQIYGCRIYASDTQSDTRIPGPYWLSLN